MTIKDNILFHNVSEMLYSESVGGDQLIRVPVSIIDQMLDRMVGENMIMGS